MHLSLDNPGVGCYIVPIPDDVGRAVLSKHFQRLPPWLQAADAKSIRTPPADGDAMRALQRSK